MTPLLAPAIPWPALTVLVPLLGGLVLVAAGGRAARLAMPVAISSLVVALLTAAQVHSHGPRVVVLGGWPAPLGIRLGADGLAAAFLLITALVTTAVAAYASRPGSSQTGSGRRATVFWPLLFLMWAALNGVFTGQDLFNLYVALELLTLTAVAMVALRGSAGTQAAAMRYLLVALLGSLAYLLGAVLIYSTYGTLDMALLKAVAAPGPGAWVAGALVTAGLLAKTALFPLHGWLPPAHAGAPTPASALLSALVVKASFYLLVRFWFDALPGAGSSELTLLLGALGSGAILYGSILALRQHKLKLIVAYSTVAQLGYLFLIFPLAGDGGEAQPWSASAWTGGMFHALAHALAKAAMFLAAGLMIRAAGSDRLEAMAGLAQHLPVATFAFALAALSLMGLPPSGGFTAKYLLLTSALAGGVWWAAAVILAGGLLAAAYLFRVLNQLLREPAGTFTGAPAGRRGEFVALALAVASVLLGLFSAWPYALLRLGRAAAAVEGLP